MEQRQSAIKLSSGSLDFANAVEEWETSYVHLLAWSRQVGLVSEQAAAAMEQRAAASPDEAQHTLELALSLRAIIHRIFWAIAHGESARASDLTSLNEQLPGVLSKLRVVRHDQGFTWEWDEQDAGLDRMLWPIVRSAAELLMAPDLRWLKACAGEDCDQLFLDLSRNHSRRWCEMQHCGMLVKSRRHYARKRQAIIEMRQKQ